MSIICNRQHLNYTCDVGRTKLKGFRKGNYMITEEGNNKLLS